MNKLKALLVLLLTAGLTLVAVPAASAKTTTTSGTITTSAHLNKVLSSMAHERNWSLAGCGLNKSVDALLKYTKAGKTPPIAIAREVVKLANKQGNGMCGAATTAIQQQAQLTLNFYLYKKVYIKQIVDSPDHWWSKLTVTRWIGPDSKHLVKSSYTV